MKITKPAVATLVALTIALPASADLVQYTDLASFQAAAPGLAAFNFAGLGPVSGTTDYSTPAGLTVEGVNFVGLLNTGAYYLGVYGTPAPGLLLGAFSTASGYEGDTIITFPGAIYAVGFDLTMGSAPDAGPFTLTLSNLQTSFFGAAISPDSPAFAGVVSTEAFTSVTIRAGTPDPDNYYAPLISDVTFGPVPEPGTFALASILATGLFASQVGKKARRHHENSRV